MIREEVSECTIKYKDNTDNDWGKEQLRVIENLYPSAWPTSSSSTHITYIL